MEDIFEYSGSTECSSSWQDFDTPIEGTIFKPLIIIESESIYRDLKKLYSDLVMYKREFV
jgi:hypothetical protein